MFHSSLNVVNTGMHRGRWDFHGSVFFAKLSVTEHGALRISAENENRTKSDSSQMNSHQFNPNCLFEELQGAEKHL